MPTIKISRRMVVGLPGLQSLRTPVRRIIDRNYLPQAGSRPRSHYRLHH